MGTKFECRDLCEKQFLGTVQDFIYHIRKLSAFVPSVDVLKTVGKINLQEYLLRSRGTLIKLPLMERAIERLTTNPQKDRAISANSNVLQTV